jgi:hypothetical protein
MAKKLLGDCALGFISVECWVDDQDPGGYFSFLPDEPSGKPRIVVGIKNGEELAFNTLLHETIEFQLSHQDLRYIKDSKLDGDPSNFLFLFDHVQYQEVLNRATTFIRKFLPLVLLEVKNVALSARKTQAKPLRIAPKSSGKRTKPA